MRLCVFCSSRDEVAGAYHAAARQLGGRLGERSDTLVYGGTAVGVMGQLAGGARDAGASVVGIIPRGMVERGLADGQADELVVTDTMAERETVMLERAQAFCVLPGGLGTLEELLEVLTLKHLGYHELPVAVVDLRGFYQPLLALFDELVDQGFAGGSLHELYRRVEDVDGLFAYLDQLTAPA